MQDPTHADAKWAWTVKAAVTLFTGDDSTLAAIVDPHTAANYAMRYFDAEFDTANSDGWRSKLQPFLANSVAGAERVNKTTQEELVRRLMEQVAKPGSRASTDLLPNFVFVAPGGVAVPIQEKGNLNVKEI